MKRARTSIHVLNRECSIAGSMFTQQTAASIAIANKSAPTTSPTTSSANGALAAARRATTFLSVRCFSEKCEWVRTSQTSAHVHRPPKNPRRLQEQLVLRPKDLRLRRPVHKQLRLRLRVRRQQRRPRRPGLRLPARLHLMHRRHRDNPLASLRHHPDKLRTLLLEGPVR